MTRTEIVTVKHQDLVNQGVSLIIEEMDTRDHTPDRLKHWHDLATGYHELVRSLNCPRLLRRSSALQERLEDLLLTQD